MKGIEKAGATNNDEQIYTQCLNLNFNNNVNSHCKIDIYPSLNPLDSMDYRKDGVQPSVRKSQLTLLQQIRNDTKMRNDVSMVRPLLRQPHPIMAQKHKSEISNHFVHLPMNVKKS
jgi:hypothetical protein